MKKHPLSSDMAPPHGAVQQEQAIRAVEIAAPELPESENSR